MPIVKIGQKVDDFTQSATSDQDITLSQFKGKNVVIYFYPKDSTPGCTTEGQNFRDLIKEALIKSIKFYELSSRSILGAT